MAKKSKKRSKQGNKPSAAKHPANQRPIQLIIFLVLWAVGIFSLLYLWFTYAGVEGGDSLSTYQTLLLVTALADLLIGVLLYFGLKIGFFAAVVMVCLDFLTKIMSLDIVYVLIDGLCIYLLLCQATCAYFRVKRLKAPGSKEETGG